MIWKEPGGTGTRSLNEIITPIPLSRLQSGTRSEICPAATCRFLIASYKVVLFNDSTSTLLTRLESPHRLPFSRRPQEIFCFAHLLERIAYLLERSLADTQRKGAYSKWRGTKPFDGDSASPTIAKQSRVTPVFKRESLSFLNDMSGPLFISSK